MCGSLSHRDGGSLRLSFSGNHAEFGAALFESCDDDFASADLDCGDFRVSASCGETRAFALLEAAFEFDALRRTLSDIDIGEFHRHSVGFILYVAKQDVRIDDS